MDTERLDIHTPDGRTVAVWRSQDGTVPQAGPPVILSAGFARRMRDVGSIALGLTRNGATVYRFDSLDHIGLSDGEIIDFSLGSMTSSLAATVGLARRREGTSRVYLVTLSLATLAAYQLAAADPDITRILSVSGVVDGRRTLHQVIGTDYTTFALDALPPAVAVLGHQVRPHAMWHELCPGKPFALDQVTGQLARISAAVVNFVAADDPWVDVGSCEQAFAAGGGERMIVRLPYTGHDLGRNPVAITTILEQLASLGTGDGPLTGQRRQVRIPGFDELLQNRIEERQRYLDERAAVRAHAGPAAEVPA